MTYIFLRKHTLRWDHIWDRMLMQTSAFGCVWVAVMESRSRRSHSQCSSTESTDAKMSRVTTPETGHGHAATLSLKGWFAQWGGCQKRYMMFPQMDEQNNHFKVITGPVPKKALHNLVVESDQSVRPTKCGPARCSRAARESWLKDFDS